MASKICPISWAAPSRLANISTRKQVGRSENNPLGIAACGGNGGWMPKVSTKHVQRRIAELDSVAQPKRSSVLKRVLAFIILAIIAVAAFFSANRTSSDFLRLTLKQGSAESNRQLSDAEARAK